MVITTSIIETGVDRLVNLVKQRGMISVEDAAKELSVSYNTVEEWADFLEEEGIISLEYKFTKPFLVERKLSKKDIESKQKEFACKKDVFVRKAETTLSFLDKEAERLKNIKSEFDQLKNELGMEVESVKKELAQLDEYEKIKKDLDKKLNDQTGLTTQKIEEMNQQVSREQKRYKEIVQEIRQEENDLKKEQKQAKTIEEGEKELKKRLAGLKSLIGKLEFKLESEEIDIKGSEDHIGKLRALAEAIKKNVESEKGKISLILNQNREQEQRILDLQKQVLEKTKEKRKKTAGVNNISSKLKKFFSEKMRIFEIIDKIDKDRNEMEKNLAEVIKKAKSLELSSKTGKDISRQISELENKFNDVTKKKGIFEEELKELGTFLKTD